MASIASSYLPSASLDGPPRFWTRPGSSDNLIVLTDSELVVASVARRKRESLLARLDAGEAPDAVLGAKATYIPLAAIRSVSAPLSRLQLVVDYALASRKFTTRKIPLADHDVQAEILEQVEQRLGPGAEYVRSTGSRFFSAGKPFHLLMAVALLAGGFNHLAVETFGVGTDRELIPQDGGRRKPFNLAEARQRMPKVRMIPYAGLVVLAGTAATGILLAAFGYHAVISGFMVAGGACALWTFARFAFPPVTISVVPGGK